jgi:hypothetical protein
MSGLSPDRRGIDGQWRLLADAVSIGAASTGFAAADDSRQLAILAS